jgi:hypothetical protein
MIIMAGEGDVIAFIGKHAERLAEAISWADCGSCLTKPPSHYAVP